MFIIFLIVIYILSKLIVLILRNKVLFIILTYIIFKYLSRPQKIYKKKKILEREFLELLKLENLVGNFNGKTYYKRKSLKKRSIVYGHALYKRQTIKYINNNILWLTLEKECSLKFYVKKENLLVNGALPCLGYCCDSLLHHKMDHKDYEIRKIAEDADEYEYELQNEKNLEYIKNVYKR